jgi:hypothetical protein
MLLSAGEIIKKSWHDYTEHWHEWSVFSLLLIAPSLLVVLSGSVGMYIESLFPGAGIITNIIVFIFIVAGAIIGYWSSLAIISAVGHFIRTGQLTTWKENYSTTVKFIWPSFYTSLFAGVLIILGLLLIFIPGIIFSIWFYFALYFVILDGKRGWSALGASKLLVKGRWWATWWRLLAPGFVFGLVIGIIYAIFGAIVNILPLGEESLALINNIASVLVSSLAIPLTTLAIAHLFNSLQTNPLVSAPTEPPAIV